VLQQRELRGVGPGAGARARAVAVLLRAFLFLRVFCVLGARQSFVQVSIFNQGINSVDLNFFRSRLSIMQLPFVSSTARNPALGKAELIRKGSCAGWVLARATHI